MAGPVLSVGSTLTCPHGAPAVPATGSSRVAVGGLPVVTVVDAIAVAGCPFTVPAGGGSRPQPCVRLQWLVPAARVLVGGQPLVLATSEGECFSAEGIPAGAPVVTAAQSRVVAS
jgi:hypothetical protein